MQLASSRASVTPQNDDADAPYEATLRNAFQELVTDERITRNRKKVLHVNCETLLTTTAAEVVQTFFERVEDQDVYSAARLDVETHPLLDEVKLSRESLTFLAHCALFKEREN